MDGTCISLFESPNSLLTLGESPYPVFSMINDVRTRGIDTISYSSFAVIIDRTGIWQPLPPSRPLSKINGQQKRNYAKTEKAAEPARKDETEGRTKKQHPFERTQPTCTISFKST